MRRVKELPTLTVKHIKDVNYVLLQVDCDDRTYAVWCRDRSGKKKAKRWTRSA